MFTFSFILSIASEGQAVQMDCYAAGYPTPSITWRRENNALLPTGLFYLLKLIRLYFFLLFYSKRDQPKPEMHTFFLWSLLKKQLTR